MMNSTAKKSSKNIALSFLSQLVTMILGLVVPRLMLVGFGSEINGFFNTVNQLYSYLEILRAGVGMAAMQALYGPIVREDYSSISRIISTSKKYFNKLGAFYLLATIALSIGMTLFGNVNLADYEVFLIVLFHGISGWISFSLIQWFVDLLRAEGKNYVFISIQLLTTILSRVLEIALIYITHNPLLVKSVTLVTTVLQYLIFVVYRKKYYRQYNFSAESDLSLLKNRRSYLTFHICSLICTNTDVVVLTFFCGYKIASVYSIYYMIVNGVNAIVNTIYSSTSFLLGHSYQRGLEEFRKVHDVYFLVYQTLTASLFSICYVLMIPFIRLYTQGIDDIEYVYAYLPVLFCIIQIITCGKNVGEITVNVGGLARNVVGRAILEAAINLLLSLVLVQYIGIYGVLIATIVAILYRLIDVLIFSNKYVLQRKPIKNSLMLLSNMILFLGFVVITKRISVTVNSYGDFFLKALIISPVIIVVFFEMQFLLFGEERRRILEYIKKKNS